MTLLGYDIGSSSVKAALLDADTGECLATAFSPKQEAPISSPRPGWAEQRPEDWWRYLEEATSELWTKTSRRDVCAIGISYQMHGLVCVDRSLNPLRPAIIWCDSRAVPYGNVAFEAIGPERCIGRLLNSPGNFTAAKLAWVKENEPEVYRRIYKILLPGEWIAARMSGEACTTVSGLSEGILWDFVDNAPSRDVLSSMGIEPDFLAPVMPTFGIQGKLLPHIASGLGLSPGIPVSYRAGDQPNNALSLKVMQSGELAATAGTSGVIYGVSDKVMGDPASRINTFAHVNYTPENPRLGLLLCVNGTGILNSWMRRNVAPDALSYPQMNESAAAVPVGSDGVCIYPFGNGAERILGNKAPGCSIHGIDFNRHTRAHLYRAAQEGIAFCFRYGMDILKEMGMKINTIHAANANMFLSPVFCETVAGVTGAVIELYDTNGAAGAALGAGMGAGVFSSVEEALSSLKCISSVTPTDSRLYGEAYSHWSEIFKQKQIL